MEVKEKLKQLLEDASITVKILAEDINKSTGSIYGYLRGDTSIDIDSLLIICKKYGLPMSYFYTDPEMEALKNAIIDAFEQMDRLEFILSSVLLQQDKDLKQGAPLPETIYQLPQVIELGRQYDLYKAINKTERVAANEAIMRTTYRMRVREKQKENLADSLASKNKNPKQEK